MRKVYHRQIRAWTSVNQELAASKIPVSHYFKTHCEVAVCSPWSLFRRSRAFGENGVLGKALR